MTTGTATPLTMRVYPDGWDRVRGFDEQRYAVRGSEQDGTARVPFDNYHDAQQAAADAGERTGALMEVVMETGAGWAYRPHAVCLGMNAHRAAYQWLHANGHVCNDIIHHRADPVTALIAARYPGGVDGFIASGREPVVTPVFPWTPREEPCRREACVKPAPPA